MWASPHREQLGNSSPRSCRIPRKTYIHIYCIEVLNEEEKQFCPQRTLGHVWGHLWSSQLGCSWHRVSGGRGCCSTPTEPRTGPQRTTRLHRSGCGEAEEAYPAWPSGLEGLIHLYYRPKSVSSPQRKNGRLITFPYVLPRIFLGKTVWEHHLETEHSRQC